MRPVPYQRWSLADLCHSAPIAGLHGQRTRPLVVLALAAGAMALWGWSLSTVDPRAMSDLGLISVMPPTMLLAGVLLAVAFGLALRTEPMPEHLAMLLVVCWIFMAYGAGTLIYDAPRFATTYVHAGIADAIGRTGELFPLIDARFDWPVFFILLAFISQLIGLDSPIALAGWVPVVSNLLYMPPLVLALGSLTTDRRLVWGATWLFFLGNWVGQDYMSPQGFAFLLYLTMLAVVLRWFSRRANTSIPPLDWLRRLLFARLKVVASSPVESAGPPAATRRRTLAGLVILLVLLFGVMAASHQLTPFIVLGEIAGLVILRQCTLRGLPTLMTVILGAWLSYMAVTFLGGNLPGIVAEAGQVGEVATQAVVARVLGSTEHMAVVYVRLALSVALWAAAAIGAVRRLLTGHWDVSAGLLAALPFGAILLQSYGGELMLRVFLFTLPFVSFFAAAAVWPSPRRSSRLLASSFVAVSIVLMVAFVVARYGNDRAEGMSAAQVAAVDYLYERAGPDDLILSVSPNAPWLYRDFEGRRRFNILSIIHEPIASSPSRAVVDALASNARRLGGYPTYLLITRSQIAALEMFGRTQPGGMDALVDALRQRDGFEVVWEHPDAIIFSVEGA